ncbi:MAG: BON domain-containing protein [Methylococcales bacterium]|nr:MAG: BON domain-containing protein [Methylococcales bacterium]
MKKAFLIIMLLNTLSIVACVPTANNQEIITEKTLAQDRRTREIILSDREIISDAYSDLNAEDAIKSQCHITINTYNGAVLITGEAPTEALKAKIIAIVQVVSNVKMVHDNLTISRPSSLESRASDKSITQTVKTALKQIRTLPDFDPAMIKVVTENGIVYLLGLVHRDEGSVVINVTKLQPNIKQIITVFEYLD